MSKEDFPYLGFGLGLRTKHYEEIIKTKPKDISWFEIISENFMVGGGKPLYYLDKIRQDYPIVMHGVSLSIAGDTPIDYDYLDKLKVLEKRIEPAWISDHLAWVKGSAHNLHDLLPVPYTEDALNHVIERVKKVQDYLGRRILIENPSTYAAFNTTTIAEYDFLNALCKETECLLMLDINNIFVSSENHGWDAYKYISEINPKYVKQHHLAGHTYSYAGKIIIDTHDQPVREEVWDLYAHAVKHLGKVSMMIERDDNIPPLSELIDEINYAKKIQERAIIESNEGK